MSPFKHLLSALATGATWFIVAFLGSTPASAQEQSPDVCSPDEFVKLLHAGNALNTDIGQFTVLAALGGQAKCQFTLQTNACLQDALARVDAYLTLNDVSENVREHWAQVHALSSGMNGMTVSYVVRDKKDGSPPTLSKFTLSLSEFRGFGSEQAFSAEQLDLSALEQLCSLAGLSDEELIAQLDEADRVHGETDEEAAPAAQEASPVAVDLGAQITRCMSIPPGVAGAGIAVEVRFTTDGVGNVRDVFSDPPASDAIVGVIDSISPTALELRLANAAVRAVKRCGPYTMVLDEEVIVNFGPYDLQ